MINKPEEFKKENKPKKQHKIPKFILNLFKGNGQLFVKLNGEYIEQIPKDINVEKNIYNIDFSILGKEFEKYDHFFLEKHFAKLEYFIAKNKLIDQFIEAIKNENPFLLSFQLILMMNIYYFIFIKTDWGITKFNKVQQLMDTKSKDLELSKFHFLDIMDEREIKELWIGNLCSSSDVIFIKESEVNISSSYVTRVAYNELVKNSKKSIWKNSFMYIPISHEYSVIIFPSKANEEKMLPSRIRIIEANSSKEISILHSNIKKLEKNITNNISSVEHTKNWLISKIDWPSRIDKNKEEFMIHFNYCNELTVTKKNFDLFKRNLINKSRKLSYDEKEFKKKYKEFYIIEKRWLGYIEEWKKLYSEINILEKE